MRLPLHLSVQTADFYTYNMFAGTFTFKKVNSNSLLLSSYLDTRNNPTDMTRNIYKFCQQDYGFYFCGEYPLINHAHLTYSIPTII